MKKSFLSFSSLPLLSAVCCLSFLLPFSAHAATVYLINPLGITDPRLLIGRIIAGILSIVGSFSVLMFVYAGVLWITAQGEPKKVQRGKDIMLWATLGLAVIAGAYVLVNAIINILATGSAVGS
jgi:Type IV secretion system pilin